MSAGPVVRHAAARFLAAWLLAAFSALALAQAKPQEAPAYEPSVGQEGKDVVWVPTPQIVVDTMLDMAQVKPGETVIDLGSGDGRTVITAAKRGANALGIEYNPDMVELSKRKAQEAGVAGKAQFKKADLFETDLSQADVITMFLLPDINLKLRPKILDLKPGTRVVSNTFTMGDWQPDDTVTLSEDQGCTTSWCTALMWIVPAKVEGRYVTPLGELRLKQRFQMLSGTLRTQDKTVPVQGKVLGEQISFTAGGRQYQGRLDGKRLELKGWN